MRSLTRQCMRMLAVAAVVARRRGSRRRPAGGQDRPARHAGRAVRGGRPGRHARRRAGREAAQRHGRGQEDRDHQGLVGRQARRGRQRDPQARGAGQGRHHGRPALRLRGHRGEELLEDPAQHDLHQRLVGRAGHHARGSLAQLLPLQHRGRAVDGGPGRVRLQGQGLQEDGPHRRGLRLPVLPGAGLHDRVLQGWAARSPTRPGYRSAARTTPPSSPSSPATWTRSWWCWAAPTR